MYILSNILHKHWRLWVLWPFKTIQMTSLEFNLWVGAELYILCLIFNDKKWGYFRYYLAYGYSGTYWAGLEIEIDIRVTSLISVVRIWIVIVIETSNCNDGLQLVEYDAYLVKYAWMSSYDVTFISVYWTKVFSVAIITSWWKITHLYRLHSF